MGAGVSLGRGGRGDIREGWQVRATYHQFVVHGWQPQRATYRQLGVHGWDPEDDGDIADRGRKRPEPPEGLLVDLGRHDLRGGQGGG